MPNKNPQEYYEYYDLVFLNKNYREEALSVLAISEKYSGKKPTNIIDIGCGTGRHDMVFAENGCKVLGVDTDCPIIDLAEAKKTDSSLAIEYRCQEIKDVPENNFDLAVALFNVINYLETPDHLISFFDEIGRRLNENGMFIFDCWNGIAAIIDNPREKSSSMDNGETSFEITSRPTIDLMEQLVKMDNQVVVKTGDETKKYNYSYNSTLWTPWTLKNTLAKAGFDVLNICAWMQPDKKADQKDWKITFICQKKK